jgi:Tfp pilus assembly protein PilF
VAAYYNSLSSPFIFDDLPAIVDNQTLRHFWSALSPPPNGGGVIGRPLANLSLGVNYAVGGLQVWGYHATNLAIHILAGLTLFGIVRRTLLERPTSNIEHPTFKSNRADVASNQGIIFSLSPVEALPLALAVAVIWTVHPLQTESVTCVVQRTESLMGLFYLLTLYCFIRGVESAEARGQRTEDSDPPPSLKLRRTGSPESGSLPNAALQPFSFSVLSWRLASIFCCALGMATKEVMVTAPLMVLLYDRTFLAGTFREAWRRRGGCYLGLFGTWLLLGYLVVHMGGRRGEGAGLDLGITPWTYALTQCRAVVLYLGLAVWPHPLVLDYGTDVVQQAATVAPQAMVLTLLAGGTMFMLRYRPVLGFLGAWFFLILAPSSSVVPLVAQTMAEHRMYLPLAAVVAGVVMGLYRWLGRRSMIVFAAAALGLGCATFQRNKDYRSELAIWSDTAAKCPENARAHYNLGNAMVKTPDQIAKAISEYEVALQIKPDYAEAHDNLGEALLDLPGRSPDAMLHFEAAMRINPEYAEAHSNLANVLVHIPGRLPDAISEYETALRIDPVLYDANNNLGIVLASIPGRLPEAIGHFEAAVRINPGSAAARNNLALARQALEKSKGTQR